MELMEEQPIMGELEGMVHIPTMYIVQHTHTRLTQQTQIIISRTHIIITSSQVSLRNSMIIIITMQIITNRTSANSNLIQQILPI
jgi:hypothetical protein